MVVPSLPPLADKAAVRAALRAERKAFAASLAPETRAALEAELTRRLEPLLFGRSEEHTSELQSH